MNRKIYFFTAVCFLFESNFLCMASPHDWQKAGAKNTNYQKQDDLRESSGHSRRPIQLRSFNGKDLWAIPDGFAELDAFRHEEKYSPTARRELMDECGLDQDAEDKLMEYSVTGYRAHSSQQVSQEPLSSQEMKDFLGRYDFASAKHVWFLKGFLGTEAIDTFLDWPLLPYVKTLDLSLREISPEAFTKILSSSSLSNLTELIFPNGPADSAILKNLFSNPSYKKLEFIGFTEADIPSQDIQIFSEKSPLISLNEIDFSFSLWSIQDFIKFSEGCVFPLKKICLSYAPAFFSFQSQKDEIRTLFSTKLFQKLEAIEGLEIDDISIPGWITTNHSIFSQWRTEDPLTQRIILEKKRMFPGDYWVNPVNFGFWGPSYEISLQKDVSHSVHADKSLDSLVLQLVTGKTPITELISVDHHWKERIIKTPQFQLWSALMQIKSRQNIQKEYSENAYFSSLRNLPVHNFGLWLFLNRLFAASVMSEDHSDKFLSSAGVAGGLFAGFLNAEFFLKINNLELKKQLKEQSAFQEWLLKTQKYSDEMRYLFH